MPAITEIKKITVSMKLNNGTTTTGKVKTASVSLGNLNKSTFDADKVIAIVNALSPCFDLMLHSLEKTEVSQLIDGD